MEEKRRDISCKQQKAGNQRREDVRAITGADRKKRRQRLSGLLQADAEKGKLKEEHISREERTRRRESDSERKKKSKSLEQPFAPLQLLCPNCCCCRLFD